MQDDIVAQGVELMLYGMGTVVLFLGLLIIVTTAMSRLLARHFPESEPVPVASGLRSRSPAPGGEDPNLVAAISAAIHQHRARRK
jgi:oxaloacetate decarboxylase gamma subunit